MAERPFDAVLFVAFGGPTGPADVRPFLENVLRGRRIPADRLDAVVHHYELFGGVSPLTELTHRQAIALEHTLRARGLDLPVHVGMRNWHPFLSDTLIAMHRRGVRRAIGLLASAHRSYSGCWQYKLNVDEALRAVISATGSGIEITWTGDWHMEDGFIGAWADRITDALRQLPEVLRDEARLVFTAHSIPMTMAQAYPYEAQLRASAAAIAARAGRSEWGLVFQSRSGRPDDPWLEPDVGEYLRAERGRGLRAAVIAPIGFVCDHIEVLYDLDVEAAQICDAIGLRLARATTVTDHPAFIGALATVVEDTHRRYKGGRPLPIAPATRPDHPELPPPRR